MSNITDPVARASVRTERRHVSWRALPMPAPGRVNITDIPEGPILSARIAGDMQKLELHLAIEATVLEVPKRRTFLLVAPNMPYEIELRERLEFITLIQAPKLEVFLFEIIQPDIVIAGDVQ